MNSLENITNTEIRHNSRFKNFLRKTLLYGSMLLGAGAISQEALAQYNVTIHARSLDKTAEGSAISGAVISKDGGDVVKVTGANGDVVLTDVGGPITIKLSQQDYLTFSQSFNITSDTELWFATPAHYRSGTFGTNVETVAEYFKDIYVEAGPTHDPIRWSQIIPVPMQIVNATKLDSTNIMAAANTMEQSTGYNLFNFVSSAGTDPTYIIYMHAGTDASDISSDVAGISLGGYSNITNSDPIKITHEIATSQDNWPTSAIPIPTNADPAVQTRPPWQPIDGSYLSLKIEQDFRKKNNKQSLMIGLMQNYIALGNVGTVPVVSPVNNSIDLDTLLTITGTKDANAIWYDYKITSDPAGNAILISQTDLDRPRINVDLEPGKTYYIFERARNSTSTGAWSAADKITTKSLPAIIFPGATSVTKPANNATEVPAPNTPLECAVATDALQYRYVAKDIQGNTVLDSLVNSNAQTQSNRFKGNRIYTITVTAKNNNGFGPVSASNTFTTYDNAPTVSTGTPISTDIVDPTQPTTFTYVESDKDGDAIKSDIHLWSAKTDTTITGIVGLLYTLPANKLKSNTLYSYTITAKSGTKQTTSSTQTFNTFNNAPTVNTGTPTSTDVLDSRQPTVFAYIASDKDNDPLAFGIHLWSATTDTTMNGITALTYTLPANRLKEKTTYSYTITASDGKKQTTSNIQTFNTKDNTVIIIIYPGANALTKPANNATEVPASNTPLESTISTNALQYEYIAKEKATGKIALDTIVDSNTETTTKRVLKGNTTYTMTVEGINTNGHGPKSAINTFTTYDNAPVVDTKAIPDSVDTKADVKFEWIASDKDQDVLTFNERIWNTKQDTTIYNITEQSYTLKKESGFLKPGQIYNYTVTADDGKKQTTSSTKILNTKLITGIEDIFLNKDDFVVYPNPMTENATIKFGLKEESNVEIKVYDMTGKQLRQYNMGNLIPDVYEAPLSGANLPSGMYFVTVKAKNEVETRKVIKK
jgi:hypothetical protein